MLGQPNKSMNYLYYFKRLGQPNKSKCRMLAEIAVLLFYFEPFLIYFLCLMLCDYCLHYRRAPSRCSYGNLVLHGPPLFPIVFRHFRLYEVVSRHMCVLPYMHRKILKMLPKLTELLCSKLFIQYYTSL